MASFPSSPRATTTSRPSITCTTAASRSSLRNGPRSASPPASAPISDHSTRRATWPRVTAGSARSSSSPRACLPYSRQEHRDTGSSSRYGIH
jgi:hypothetical protein